MSRSTFSILPYINRQKVKADGTANILCRITVDGKSAAISTGISCTPQEWNAKKGEVRNARDNGRLASFLAEVKDKYNSLLTANGIITVEMLKAVLKDKDTTGRFLLSFGDTIVEWYRTAKARQTFLHKRLRFGFTRCKVETKESSILIPFRGRSSGVIGTMISSAARKAFVVTIPKEGGQSMRM